MAEQNFELTSANLSAVGNLKIKMVLFSKLKKYSKVEARHLRQQGS